MPLFPSKVSILAPRLGARASLTLILVAAEIDGVENRVLKGSMLGLEVNVNNVSVLNDAIFAFNPDLAEFFEWKTPRSCERGVFPLMFTSLWCSPAVLAATISGRSESPEQTGQDIPDSPNWLRMRADLRHVERHFRVDSAGQDQLVELLQILQAAGVHGFEVQPVACIATARMAHRRLTNDGNGLAVFVATFLPEIDRPHEDFGRESFEERRRDDRV